MATPASDEGWISVDGGVGSATWRISDTDCAPGCVMAVGQDVGNASGIGLVLPGALNANAFRDLLAQGKLPQADDLPMAGWLNEHDTPLPLATIDHPVELHAVAAIVAEPSQEPEVLLQLGFNTAATLQALQPKVNVVVAIDRSASVGLQNVQAMTAGILDLADSLPAQSSLAVLAFDYGGETLFAEPVYSPALRVKLKSAVQEIKPSGGTDLYVGLQTSFEILAKLGPGTTQRRVLLVTDGLATRGDHGNADFVDLGTKSGVSISTIGIGAQANAALLTNLAKFTGGTYYAAPTITTLQSAFTKDLGSLLVPVASNLSVAIDLASGWTVRDSYGLVVTQVGNTVFVGGAAQPATADAVGSADTTMVPDAGPPDFTPVGPSVLGLLYPSQKNGLIVLRLQPGNASDVQAAMSLQLATAKWSYTLTKKGSNHSHQKTVEVAGLVAIPDGGVEFYSHPLGRRTLAIVRAGEALRQACALAQKGIKPAALATLAASKAYSERQLGFIVDANLDPHGAIEDALGLTEALTKIVGAL